MPTWTIRFDGGFAWMFDGTKSATVALSKKPAGSSAIPHEMVLLVDKTTNIDEMLTTLPGRPTDKGFAFVLRGDVDIKVDDKDEPNTSIKRNVSQNEPPSGTIDDFFFVYSIKRLANQSGAPDPKSSWPSTALATLKLDGGKLTVLESIFKSKLDIKDGDNKLVTQRKLSSQIEYTSDFAVNSKLAFETRDGDVVLLPDGKNIFAVIEANCTCAAVEPTRGEPLKGFDIIFNLYSSLQKPFRLVPCMPASMPSDDGKRSPGPDCPPSDHDI